MTPTTLAGFAFFLASLGPGFVYIRVAERRQPRPPRSALGEAVEMIVMGAAISIVALIACFGLARVGGVLDWQALIKDPADYLADHPYRLVAPICAALVLSYGGAYLGGLAIYARSPKVVHPGVTMWQQALWRDRPTTGHATIATVGMKDGRTVTGMVHGFTAQETENRELLLVAPLAVTTANSQKAEKVVDTFWVIRENDVLYVSGRYWGPKDSAAEVQGDGTGSETDAVPGAEPS